LLEAQRDAEMFADGAEAAAARIALRKSGEAERRARARAKRNGNE
jgi:hypothetical protein